MALQLRVPGGRSLALELGYLLWRGFATFDLLEQLQNVLRLLRFRAAHQKAFEAFVGLGLALIFIEWSDRAPPREVGRLDLQWTWIANREALCVRQLAISGLLFWSG